MYRSVFAAAAASALLTSTFLAPASVYAKRCPVEPPTTLLTLYKRSDAIYLGRFDKTSEGDLVRDEESYKVVNINQHFTINTTLKGDARKLFERTSEEYIYKAAPEVEEGGEDEELGDEYAAVEEEFEGDYRPLKEGDSVMLFLRNGEDANNDGEADLELAHYRDGIKRLDEAAVSSYEARVRELHRIFSVPKTNDLDVVNWLVRCIEDPVTRWEGAYELLSGFRTLEWRQQQEREKAKNAETLENAGEFAAAEPENSAAGEDDEAEMEEVDEPDNSIYAQLLNQTHKDAIVKIAIKNRPLRSVGGQKHSSMARGDQTLFDLAKRWGNYKLAAAMLDWLSISGENDYSKADLMQSIGEILKDRRLISLSEEFSEIAYRDNDEAVEEEKPEADASGSAEQISSEPQAEAVSVSKPEGEARPAADKAETEVVEKPKITYGQIRGQLMAEYLNRANLVLEKKRYAAEKAKQNAKRKRIAK